LWNSESLPGTLWGAFENDFKPRTLLINKGTIKKSNFHVNHQVKVLTIRPGSLTRWYQPTADTVTIVDLYIWDKVAKNTIQQTMK
jgi:hypothetical protein